MELLCIQSQEHPKLPQGELKAVIECENMNTTIEVITEGLVILKNIDADKLDEYYQILIKRLGYTHGVYNIIKTSNISNIEKDIVDISWEKYISENFAVRLKKFNTKIDTVSIERKVGSLILDNISNISVNLTKPKSLIKLVAFKDIIFISIEQYHLNKKHFEEIKPHKRPFFYPGSMSPKLARCMVNLSRVKSGQLLLDPFCGTGGILIEAGLIGCKVIGSDVNWKMKNGTAINLEYCGIKDYRTFHLDMRELKMYEKVVAVVTDPPYGISTSTGDIESNDIFKEFFEVIYDNMEDNAYLCMASPHYIDLDSILSEVNFELVEQYAIKMHRSLTRIISVIKKQVEKK